MDTSRKDREEIIEGERLVPFKDEWSEGGVDYIDAVEISEETRTVISQENGCQIVEVKQRVQRTSSGVTWHDATQSVGSGGSWEDINVYKAKIRLA